MPQYRKLHTKSVESFDIADMPDDFTRLMWVFLPLKSCSDGRGINSPSWLKSQLFPLRMDVTLEMVAEAMNWYAQRGMIQCYTVEHRPYYQISNWVKYQGNTSKEAGSPYPQKKHARTSAEQAPEERGTANGDDFEGGNTKSRLTLELVGSSSSTDTTTNTNTNADSDTTTAAKPEAAKSGCCLDPDFAEVINAYEQNINQITPAISASVQSALEDTPKEWIIEAIGITTKNNHRSWAYVEGILRNWRTHGKDSKSPGNGRSRTAAPEPERVGGLY